MSKDLQLKCYFSDRLCKKESIKAAGALADGAAQEGQPRVGPESRTSSPDFKSPLIAVTPGSLDRGDPTVTRLSFHVSSFCRQEDPIHVSSHFISMDQKVSFVRTQIRQLPKWLYFAEVSVKLSYSKLHSLYQNGRLQFASTLLCCTAEQTFSSSPKCLPPPSESSQTQGQSGQAQLVHPDPSDSMLHPGFVWDSASVEKLHSLLSRSRSNREGTLTHPRLSQKWPFPIFMDLKVSCSHKVSHAQNATWHYSWLATGRVQGCWHSRVTNPVPQPLLQQLFQQHLPCLCSTRSLLQAGFLPLMKTEVKHLATAMNWSGRLELTRGHVRTAQWQFGLSRCSGSRQAARKIKVKRPIRDSTWHVLLSTRINLSLLGNGLPCSTTLSHSVSSSWLSTCHLQ